jgi:L-fucose isomerase-like protein
MRRFLSTLRVGYAGGKNDIMFSMSADDFTLKQKFGVTTVTVPMEAFYEEAEKIPAQEAKNYWRSCRKLAGQCATADRDGILSSRYYLAARALCRQHGLAALSINCFPHLKSKICLAVARLNDDGIASACEGDLYSTVLMHVLARVTGQAAFNGDFLRMYPEVNEVLFSHCGAGAFSLATKAQDIRLQNSIETRDGLAICYPTRASGTITLANLMGARETFRLSAMSGESVLTGTEYEGTPLRVKFSRPVKDILQAVAESGAGHHWNGAFGDFSNELKLLCEWQGVRFNLLTGGQA